MPLAGCQKKKAPEPENPRSAVYPSYEYNTNGLKKTGKSVMFFLKKSGSKFENCRIHMIYTTIRGRRKRQRKGNNSVMADKIIENNQVSIMGQIVSQFTFSHQVFGEGFYLVDLMVKRLSDSEDMIPVMVSERLIDVTQDYEGEYLMVSGQFRSYNRHEEKKNRLVLSVFAREISFVEDEDDSVKSNQIYLDGYICKPPVYRKTPLGREIADLLIAVNRPYGKSDYIPCICWGRNARYASAFSVGGHVLIWGRIQSREYMKRISENETEKRVAYEVSVSKLEYLE